MNEIEIGKCLAFDVKGNVFPKDVIIYQIKDKSWILSFGGFCQYSISSLIKKGFPIKHKTNRIVIDMMGRNHRNFETFIHLNVVNSLLSKAFEILNMKNLRERF